MGENFRPETQNFSRIMGYNKISIAMSWFRQWVFDRDHRAEVFFVILAGLVEIYFICFLVPGDPPDEKAHIFRVAAIVSGDILPVLHGTLHGVPAWGGYVPSSLVDGLSNAVQKYYTPLLHSLDSPHQFIAFSNTAVYSPVVYIPAILAYLLGTLLGLTVLSTVMLMRIAAATFYLLIGLFSLRLLRGSSTRWLVFCVLTLPVGLYQASYVTGDTVTNALLILYVVFCLKIGLLKESLNKQQWFVFIIVTSVICMLKPSYAPFLLLLWILPNVQWWIKIILSCVSLGVGVCWQLLAGHAASGIPGILSTAAEAKSVSSSLQIQWLISHPVQGISVFAESLYSSGVDWGAGALAQIGFMDNGSGVSVAATAPLTAIILCLLAIALAVGIFPHSKAYVWAASGAVLVVGTVFVILGSLYLTFTPVGQRVVWGTQGRYFYPLVLVVCICIAVFVPYRIGASSGKSLATTGTPIIILMSSALLLTIVMHFIRYAWWFSQLSWPFGHH